MLDDGQDADLCAVQEVGGEDVGSDDSFGLGPQEARPSHRAATWRRLDAGVLEDLPDSGGGDGEAKASQLAVNPPVACGCRKVRPCRSGSQAILVENVCGAESLPVGD